MLLHIIAYIFTVYAVVGTGFAMWYSYTNSLYFVNTVKTENKNDTPKEKILTINLIVLIIFHIYILNIMFWPAIILSKLVNIADTKLEAEAEAEAQKYQIFKEA